MSLYSPDGRFVTNAVSSGFGLGSSINALRLDQSGTYTLVCSDSTYTGTNNYVLTLVKIVGDNPADEDARMLIAGQSVPGSFSLADIDVFRFTATNGEVVSIQLSSSGSFTYPAIYLYDARGDLLTYAYSSFGFQPAATLQGIRLPEDGVYTLLCQDSTLSGTNQYSLTLL